MLVLTRILYLVLRVYIFSFVWLTKKRHHLSFKKYKKWTCLLPPNHRGNLGDFPRLELVLDELQLSDSDLLPLRNETCLGDDNQPVKKPQLTYTPKWNAKRKKKGGQVGS